MTTFLLRMSSNLQSCGSRSNFTHRDTEKEPTKSETIGMICCCLGKPRKERPDDGFPTLVELNALKMGVRVDKEGRVVRDFHTAGGGKIIDQKTGKPVEYGVVRGDGTRGTLVSHRYYLSEAIFLVGLEGDRALLERIDAAIKHPVWVPVLGRSGCLPTEPIQVRNGLQEKPLLQALEEYPWLVHEREYLAGRSKAWWSGMDEEGEFKPQKLRYVIEDPQGYNVRFDVQYSFLNHERRTHRTARRVNILTKEMTSCGSENLPD
jgi:CRISPR system Cascade subunit CasD